MDFNERGLIETYALRRYDKLAELMIEGLTGFGTNTYATIDETDQHAINTFAKLFLCLFSQPDFVVSGDYIGKFILLNPTISNLAAISAFKTTDPFIAILSKHNPNLVKILALYSARNTIKIPRKIMLDADIPATSLWYSVYSHAYRGWQIDPQVAENLIEHFGNVDSRLEHNWVTLSDVYFGSTYIDGICDRPIKEKINAWVQAWLKREELP